MDSIFIIAALAAGFVIQTVILKRSMLTRPSGAALRQNLGAQPAAQILLDTSAIIDGRIADVAHIGFVPGKILVPRFVLAELQYIADSDDALRRGRGRRGLDMLNAIRERSDIELQIIEDDVSDITEVDAKLVALAQRFSADLVTTDFNLNKVASIEGVRVLNINALAQAIRPVVIPGEEMIVKVVQPGKEKHQGVGYLSDGTMIVVDQGDKLIGQEVLTVVTRVFQTVAGKMIFVERKDKTTAAPTAPAETTAEEQRPRPARSRQNNRTPQRRNNRGPRRTGDIEASLVRQTTSEEDKTDK